MLKKLKKFAKTMLANPKVRSIYVSVNRLTLSVFSSSRFLATIYSIPGFLTFNREQYAVLRARRNYYTNLTKNRQTHVELRRNVHRLEKGMIMQPRRDIFARDYINETIEFYEQAIQQCAVDSDSMDSSEMEWAHDVLREYFSVVKEGNEQVDDARMRYEATLELYNPKTSVKKAPFLRKDRAKSNIKYDDLLDLAMQRRSVRWFQQKKVPRELIDKALMVGRQAPTACNRLPYEFRIFDDPEKYIMGKDIPEVYRNVYKHVIALFHGPVDRAVTDTGFSISNPSVMPELFSWHHIALLGDIHKRQNIQEDNFEEHKPCIHYPSSLIQQNHGESLNGHGYTLWNLSDYSYKFIDVPNDYGYVTVDLHGKNILTDLSNLPKKTYLRVRCLDTIATEVKAAEAIANPLPVAAVVFPTASRLSVRSRTSGGN